LFDAKVGILSALIKSLTEVEAIKIGGNVGHTVGMLLAIFRRSSAHESRAPNEIRTENAPNSGDQTHLVATITIHDRP
jgi:hypothetical protein